MTPEQRLEKLERKMRLYDRAFNITSSRVDIQIPVTVRKHITINGASIYSGTGTPESVITAPVGSMYLRVNGGSGTTLYIKESGTGNTGWSTTA